MAKTKSKDKYSTPKFDKPRPGCRPFSGFFFFVLALLIVVSLWHFDPSQSPQNTTDPTPNPVGKFGVAVGYYSFKILGGAGWLLAIAAFYLSYMSFFRPRRMDWIKIVALLVCVTASASLLAMQEWFFAADRAKFLHGPGGVIGSWIYGYQQDGVFTGFLHDNLGVFGSALVLSIIFVTSALLLLTGNLSEAFQKFFFHFGEWKSERMANLAAKREERTKKQEKKAAEKAQKLAKKREKAEEEAKEKQSTETREEKSAPRRRRRLSAREKLEMELDAGAEELDFNIDPQPARSSRRPARKPAPDPEPAPVAATPPPAAAVAAASPAATTSKLKIIKSETLRKAPVKLPQRQGDYEFPPLDLLDKPEPVPSDDRENHEQTAQTLIETLRTFGVEATIDEIHVGPVITRFDILPAPGTKVSKIQGLENDIAMGLKALAVRILAPVPGKGCVGVEIPNRRPQPVTLREIIESEDWVSSRAEIPIGLGKDVSGKPLVADLTKMPHLLIAGSTGSGKTVCINSIIASLLYHASPDEVRFIMVDPKIVEMKVFNDLPHMLIPVVTDPKKVPGALKWLLNEMTRRYEVFAAIGVRNIAGFRNYQKKKSEREKAEREAAEAAAAAGEPNELDGNLPEAVAPEMTPEDDIEIPKSLPYIICIIDELADLMMVAPADIESGIARLAQLARAAGIHLILATQRPSVNVITGVIKANLPSRISFKVASKVDSRTILDTGGADTLIGRGDMLFLPPGSSRLIRSQGAFVSDEEISSIVENLKRNGPPVFAEEVQRQIDADDEEEGLFGAGGDEGDELFQDAIEVLRTTKRASTSMLQRRLRIGYNRAARIMELMEDRGIVGPENGSSPRDILVDLESL